MCVFRGFPKSMGHRGLGENFGMEWHSCGAVKVIEIESGMAPNDKGAEKHER